MTTKELDELIKAYILIRKNDHLSSSAPGSEKDINKIFEENRYDD